MARILKVLFGVLAVVVLLGLTVNLLATPLDELPPVDPALLITMPDGSEQPLGELLARSETPQRSSSSRVDVDWETLDTRVDVELALVEGGDADDVTGATEVPPEQVAGELERSGIVDENGELLVEWDAGTALSADDLREKILLSYQKRWEKNPPDATDVYEMAEYEHWNGRPEQAIALYRSVPKDHHSYARAQRHIGWKLYTKELDDPRRGIAFVNASVKADPFDGNAWEDLVRVYAAGIGLPVD